MSNTKLYIGTSGWAYDWNDFYPDGIPRSKYLTYYAAHFRTVEVNYSFYHLPRETTYKNWSLQTPENFIFALKLSKSISHFRRLKDAEEHLGKFLANASVLEGKLGPILIQLPPSFHIDCERVADFLSSADKIAGRLQRNLSLRFAFEFRHKDWFEKKNSDRIFDVLKSYKAAMVFAHSGRYPYPQNEPVSADFVYLRFHGPDKIFASLYARQRLEKWAIKITDWLKNGIDVYAYFNNDVHGFAVRDAKTLLEILEFSPGKN